MTSRKERNFEIISGLAIIHGPLNMRRPGMGQDMLDNIAFKGVVSRVEERLQERGERPGLSLDPLRQISQFTFSLGMREAVTAALDGNPEIESGLSVGETAAKAGRKVIGIEMGAELLLDRDRAITQAKKDPRKAVMIATVGASPEYVKDSIKDTENPDLSHLVLANIVTPTMGVLSGMVEDPAKAISALKDKFADTRNFFATLLPIAGAYHSHWMEEAQKIFQELSAHYFQLDRLDMPDGLLYSPMLNKWITDINQAFQVQQKQLTLSLNLRDGIPEMVDKMRNPLAFLTFDPADKMPGIIKANLKALEVKVPVINIFNKESFEKGVEQITKLRTAY